jgi:hypothetical protein
LVVPLLAIASTITQRPSQREQQLVTVTSRISNARRV